MTDQGIEEIYRLVEAALRNGQSSFKVHIFPFHMTVENMEKHTNSQWFGFWQNLKQGYDYFETYKVPPKITVKDKSYIIQRNETFGS